MVIPNTAIPTMLTDYQVWPQHTRNSSLQIRYEYEYTFYTTEAFLYTITENVHMTS